MGRKNRRQEHITFEIPKDLLRKAATPKFNSHQGGYGPWKDKKNYTRKIKHKNKLEY